MYIPEIVVGGLLGALIMLIFLIILSKLVGGK